MRKKRLLVGLLLIILFIIFTLLVKNVDVKVLGQTNVKVGFGSINNFVNNIFPYNEFFYNLSNAVGYLAFIICAIYGLIGLIQLIKRRSVLKVDEEILLLGFLYITTLILKIFFDFFVINYRPCLIDGILEASYPSSHTFMALIISISSIIINKKKYNNFITKISNYVCFVMGGVIIISRILSGTHWFSDIVASVILSFGLLLLYSGLITNKKSENNFKGDKHKLDDDLKHVSGGTGVFKDKGGESIFNDDNKGSVFDPDANSKNGQSVFKDHQSGSNNSGNIGIF